MNPHESSSERSKLLEMALRDCDGFGEWIRSADTKAGLLAAALGLVLSNLFDGQVALERPEVFWSLPTLFLAVFLLLLLSFLVSFVLLGLALISRLTGKGETDNMFAFPAFPTYNDFLQESDEQMLQQAYLQAETLAAICLLKHRYLRRAVCAMGSTLILFVLFNVLRY